MLRLIVLICLCGIVNEPLAKEKITWGVGHQPPRITFDGVDALGGQGGIQQTLLSDGLSQFYKADYVAMNWARFAAELKEQRHVCSSFLIKTPEREAYTHFSIPWHIDLPHRIMMKKTAWETLGRPETLSLRDISQSSELRGIIEKERSYGALDTIIRASGTSSNLTPLATRPIRGLSMLEKSRVDYTIEYPYFKEQLQKAIGHYEEDDIVMVDIEESADYYFTYVGCPKTPWGEQVIERVNKLIRTLRVDPSYLDLLKMVHTNDKDRALVERIYYQDFVSAK